MIDAAVIWTPTLSGTGPIYQQIVAAMMQARTTGVLRPGDRLPPQRVLAERLGVDLTTVSRALTEARRLHLVDAAVGRGTFVTARGAEEPILDLAMNIPPSPLGLALPGLIRTGIDALLKRSSAEALLSYHPGSGSPAERAAAAIWLEQSAGGRIPSDRIAVGAGAQSLLSAVLATLVGEGDVVLVDELTYPGFIGLARTLRLRLVGIEADADGLLPDRLEAAAFRHGARLLYLNPTLHNPTTLVMPEARRRNLADIARRAGLSIIEDDPYRPLLDSRAAPSFLAIAPENTFHVATLSKSLSPFLRTAFLVAPSVEALESVAGNLRSLTLMGPPLMTALAADWIRNGTAAEIVAGVRAEVDARHSIAKRILPDHAKLHPSAFHAWLVLKPGRGSANIVEAARGRGLAVSPASDFSVADTVPEAIRIALGAVESREKLVEALTRLSDMNGDPPTQRTALV